MLSPRALFSFMYFFFISLKHRLSTACQGFSRVISYTDCGLIFFSLFSLIITRCWLCDIHVCVCINMYIYICIYIHIINTLSISISISIISHGHILNIYFIEKVIRDIRENNYPQSTECVTNQVGIHVYFPH